MRLACWHKVTCRTTIMMRAIRPEICSIIKISRSTPSILRTIVTTAIAASWSRTHSKLYPAFHWSRGWSQQMTWISCRRWVKVQMKKMIAKLTPYKKIRTTLYHLISMERTWMNWIVFWKQIWKRMELINQAPPKMTRWWRCREAQQILECVPIRKLPSRRESRNQSPWIIQKTRPKYRTAFQNRTIIHQLPSLLLDSRTMIWRINSAINVERRSQSHLCLKQSKDSTSNQPLQMKEKQVNTKQKLVLCSQTALSAIRRWLISSDKIQQLKILCC